MNSIISELSNVGQVVFIIINLTVSPFRGSCFLIHFTIFYFYFFCFLFLFSCFFCFSFFCFFLFLFLLLFLFFLKKITQTETNKKTKQKNTQKQHKQKQTNKNRQKTQQNKTRFHLSHLFPLISKGLLLKNRLRRISPISLISSNP